MTVAVVDHATSKGARTRQAVLEAAIAHFATTGRRDTSVPTIARSVGLTPSAVYAYFPTKQALFEAALDADTAALIATALPEVVAGDDFDIDFSAIFARLMNVMGGHPLSRRVLAGEEDTGIERFAALPSEVRLHSALAELLRRGQADGTVRADIDPVVTAVGMESIVTALLMAMLQMKGVDEPTSRAVLRVLDDAIRPPGFATRTRK